MASNHQGTQDQGRDARSKPGQHDSTIERIVKTVDPPGHEVSDEDLKDPGRMTPGAPPTDNRS